jgi:N-acetylneuraminic acid mutarotase
MIRNGTLYGALAIGVLALAACGETPTEPERTGPLPSTLSAVAAVSDTWIARANMARSRADPVVGTITNTAGESILYAFGGLTPDGQVSRTVQAYNVSTNTWTLAAAMPIKVLATNGVGVIGGKLYISGGITPPAQIRRTLFVYDPSTNTWTKKRGMPSQGFLGVTGVINNRLYVLTGCSAGSTCDPFIPLAFYRYDPGTDRWRTLPTPTTAHAGGMGGVIGGKFYVAGGEAVSQLDVYDPPHERVDHEGIVASETLA